MLRSKKKSEQAFARKCYITLMSRLHRSISQDEFEQRLQALNAEPHPPVQQVLKLEETNDD